MSTPNPILAAAAPELIAIIKAIEQFNASMGPDPTQWVVKFPGAQTVLVGTVLLQLPAIATAEGGALQTLLNTTLNGWISKLTPTA